MQVNTCMSSTEEACVPSEGSLEAISRYRRVLRQDRRSFTWRCAC